MPAVVFYFQVHQPNRLWRRHGRSEKAPGLFDDRENRRILKRVAQRCYVPMTELLLELVDSTAGAFRCAFSISGTALAQMEAWAPKAIRTFQKLARTGNVELLAETSHHSLAWLEATDEFLDQIAAQRRRIGELFGQTPTTFRNTELVYEDRLARLLEEQGYAAVLAEGADWLLQGKSPRFVYRPHGCSKIKLLLRDYVYSDHIAFRFSNRQWEGYPLYAERFAAWLHKAADDEHFVGLFMDFETFGEHQSKDTGILDFMRCLPRYVLEDPRFSFATPAQVAAAHEPREELSCPRPMSWADAERDITAWLGNTMQQEAQARLYALRPRVLAAARRRPSLLGDWRRLTTSDHVYYMCTKTRSDGDVHEYFSPYYNPFDAYLLFAEALDAFEAELLAAEAEPGGGLTRPAVPA